MTLAVTNFGRTLTSGIQDVSAFLPLLGTEQCEKHVGSALEGGYLYAAATPLSIFGSLGIVRAGISVLVASISIPKPSLSLPLPTLSFSPVWFSGISIPTPSLKFTPLPRLSFRRRWYRKPSLEFTSPKLSFTSSRRLWCGARVLDNAGFKLIGRVAPLIGMNKKCYKAESRLIKILKEKHIDTPEKLSIQWRSTEWNTYLVIGTIVAALISGTPYLHLLLKDPLESIHSPWVFPFLRTVGSCLATVCCQFLIQSRVISLMKSRIIFMTMHRLLVDDLKKSKNDQAESILKEQAWFQWDESLPAEECLWSLEHYLPSIPNPRLLHSKPLLLSLVQYTLSKGRDRTRDLEENSFGDLEGWVNIPEYGRVDLGDESFFGVSSAIPSEPSLFSDPDRILHTLHTQRADHFPTPRLHRIFIVVSWLLLLISLPAAVAGYIGCFTLVTNSQSSGPLVWLGLEAVLSALRIALWAWNPSFDEKTGVDVSLKLTEKGPPMTTHFDIDALRVVDDSQVPLVSERRFLEQITPYTGPLTRFTNPNNAALYFVLTVNKEHDQIHLLMIVLDLTDRTAITLYHGSDKELACFNTSVTPNTDIGEMVATIHWRSLIRTGHRSNNLVHDLGKYYDSLLRSLNRTGNHIAWLRWKWSLFPRFEEEIQNQERPASTLAKLTEHDLLCLQQSHEHHLKTRLMKIWGGWIVNSVKAMYRDGCNDCPCVLADSSSLSDEAKQELYTFNVLLVQEWTKRELAHLQLSAVLENVLRAHVQQNAENVANADPKMSLSIEWSSVQKWRLEHERAQVKVRRENMLKIVGDNELASIWQAGQTFIDAKWAAAIEGGSFEEGSSAFPEVTTELEWFSESDHEKRASMERLKLKFTRWNDQWSYERREMEATVERISKAELKELEQAYKYPETWQADRIHSRFARLTDSEESALFVAKVSSATVYDVFRISTIDVIRTVAEKSSCRSLINVRPELVQHIPENDHLLFCSSIYLEEVDLPFIQRNRNRWWEQQKTNSWTFYLSPQDVASGGQYVYSVGGTIAHIMIFLQTPTRLRLHFKLLHEDGVVLSIQEEGKQLRVVHTAEIYESWHELRLRSYDLDQFEPGRHELQLVVVTPSYYSHNCYNLRDIALEFVDSPSESIASNSTSLL